MADVNISKYRASVVRDGSKPASPGFVVSEGQDPVNPPGTNNFVPYTGATANVELGEFGVEAGFVTLDTTPTNIPTDQGAIYWDDTRSTAALIMNGTLQHIGQDSFFYVKNSSGSTIPKGTCVGFAGTDGGSGHLLITPFLANGSVPSTYFMGVTCESIANGSFGQVMHFGELEGINTSGFTAGALLYASSTVAGAFQTTAPVAPNNIILVAAAVNSKNNGAIVVRPTLGSNINTDEGIKITSPTTGDLLQLQAGGLWENKTLAQVIGSAYVPSTRTITINGTTQDLSANRTFNVGTVTSVGLSSATSGVTIGSTPVTSSGTITLAIATASGSQQGLLSAADWTTFNNKQNALTNPVTGTGTTNYLAKFTGSTTVGNSQIFDNGTNLGIGTASPSSYGGTGLTIQSSTTSNIASLVLRNSDNSVRGHIYTSGSGNSLIVGSATSSNLQLVTADTVRATIDTLGNLGLGVTPSAWFSTVKAIDISTATALWAGGNGQPALGYNVFVNTSGNLIYKTSEFASRYEQISGQHQWHNAPSGTAGNAISFTQAMTLDANGRLALGGTTVTDSTLLNIQGSSATHNVGIILNKTNATAQVYGIINQGPFDIYNYTSSAYMLRITTGGNLLVGTTSDNGERLQVNGEITAVTRIRINKTTQSNQIFGDGNAFNISGSNNLGIRNDSGSIVFASGGANVQLILNTSGNVGIGTTSPSSRLHVSGTSSNTESGQIRITNIGQTFQIGYNTSSDYGYLNIYNAGLGYRALAIQPDGGNVLIGTTTNATGSPTFHIQNKNGLVANIAGFNFNSTSSGSNANNNFISSGNYYNGGAVVATASNATIYQQYEGEHSFYTNTGLTAGNSFSATERLRIFNDGNVSIQPGGTFTNNGARLQVSGNARFTRANDSGSILRLESVGGNGFDFSRNQTNGALEIQGNQTGFNNICLAPLGGNVGIGTSSPNRLLTVSGTTSGLIALNASSFRNTTIGSDSVGNFIVYDDTAGVYRMAINSSGNVLIGTTTDNGARLQVSGAVNITGEGTHIGIDASGGIGRIGFVKQSGAQPFMAFAADPLLIRVSNGSTIAATNTFSTVLTVATSGAATFSSSVTALGDIRSNTIYRDYQGEALIHTSGSDTQIGSFAAGTGRTISLLAGNSRRLFVTTSGNVGINTTSGFNYVSGTETTLSIANGNVASLYLNSTSTGNLFALYSSAVGSLQVYNVTQNNYPLGITSGGNVMIGTTTDSGDRLRVNGSIRTANTTNRTADSWRLGDARIDTIPNANRLLRVQIGSVEYDILARQVI